MRQSRDSGESGVQRRTIALALGGGGARGLAHIGVMQALEERGYSIEAITGCSMGGIIGALIGCGRTSREMTETIGSIHMHDLFSFGALGGLIGGRKIDETLRELVCENFEGLDIPLKVTAVDVQSGTLVILGSGPLVPALRATSALPGILSPVKHLDRVLIDGGLLNNLPIDVLRTMSLAPVVAVDVGAPHDRALNFDEERGLVGVLRRLSKRKFRTLTVELFMKSFDIPQRFITETRLAMDPPEVLIRPKLEVNFGVEDVHRIDEAIRLGHQAAVAALEEWEKKTAAPPPPQANG
ncbi:MAG: patatin-like phospholipase family protein [Gemmatimonadetes bacterium]|nr:patatin-like phospholipase family protein [Gemmatimonadota bacterium]